MPDGLQITLTIDQEQLTRVTRTLDGIRDGVPKALSTAINKTLPRLRTIEAREVRKELNLKHGDILKTIALRKASPKSLSGSLTTSRHPVPLYLYAARQVRDGVSVLVRRSRGREVIKGAFIATMKSGHVGVFKRAPDARHRIAMKDGKRRWTALPIQEQYGPTVVGVLANKPGMLQKLNEQGNALLAKNLDSQADWLLNKAQAG
jgi:hypothetical protein